MSTSNYNTGSTSNSTSSNQATTSTEGPTNTEQTAIIVGTVVGVVSFIALIVVIILVMRHKHITPCKRYSKVKRHLTLRYKKEFSLWPVSKSQDELKQSHNDSSRDSTENGLATIKVECEVPNQDPDGNYIYCSVKNHATKAEPGDKTCDIKGQPDVLSQCADSQEEMVHMYFILERDPYSAELIETDDGNGDCRASVYETQNDDKECFAPPHQHPRDAGEDPEDDYYESVGQSDVSTKAETALEPTARPFDVEVSQSAERYSNVELYNSEKYVNTGGNYGEHDIMDITTSRGLSNNSADTNLSRHHSDCDDTCLAENVNADESGQFSNISGNVDYKVEFTTDNCSLENHDSGIYGNVDDSASSDYVNAGVFEKYNVFSEEEGPTLRVSIPDVDYGPDLCYNAAEPTSPLYVISSDCPVENYAVSNADPTEELAGHLSARQTDCSPDVYINVVESAWPEHDIFGDCAVEHSELSNAEPTSLEYVNAGDFEGQYNNIRVSSAVTGQSHTSRAAHVTDTKSRDETRGRRLRETNSDIYENIYIDSHHASEGVAGDG